MSLAPAITGPVAPFNNVPINAQFYQPSQFVITAITLGKNTLVTTSINNNFVIGQLVRLTIPPTFGCRQLNEQTGYVIALPSANQVSLTIDSSMNVDPFVSSSATTKPQIMPVGDINQGQINTGRTGNITYVPGSFINISPL